LLILDVSNNNAEPNWEQLRRQGIAAVFLKASEGTSFIDTTFADRRKAANRAGLHVGAYHFARPDESVATSQAAPVHLERPYHRLRRPG
jgi:lysozyme